MSHCVQQYIVDKNYAWNSREREREIIEMFYAEHWNIPI